MTLADLVDEYLGMHQAEPMAGMMIAGAALSLLLLALFASKYFIVGFPIRVGLARGHGNRRRELVPHMSRAGPHGRSRHRGNR